MSLPVVCHHPSNESMGRGRREGRGMEGGRREGGEREEGEKREGDKVGGRRMGGGGERRGEVG